MSNAEEQGTALVDEFTRMWHEKDLPQIMTKMTDDFHFTDRGLKNVDNLDKSQYEKWAKTLFDTCDDIHVYPKKTIVSEDKKSLVLEFKMTFKYVKDNESFPAKAEGQTVVTYGVTVSKMEGEKMTECQQYVNYFWNGE